MRALRLLAVAAEAEGLRLRREAALLARSAVLFAAAAVFGLALLVMLHVAAFAWLAPSWGPAMAALLVAAGDLLIALALVLIGRPGNDPVAQEALAIRRASLAEATEHPFRGLVSVGGVARSSVGQMVAERAIRSVLRR